MCVLKEANEDLFLLQVKSKRVAKKWVIHAEATVDIVNNDLNYVLRNIHVNG